MIASFGLPSRVRAGPERLDGRRGMIRFWRNHFWYQSTPLRGTVRLADVALLGRVSLSRNEQILFEGSAANASRLGSPQIRHDQLELRIGTTVALEPVHELVVQRRALYFLPSKAFFE